MKLVKKYKQKIKELFFFEKKVKIQKHISKILQNNAKLVPIYKGQGYTVKYVVLAGKKYFLKVTNKLDEYRFRKKMEARYMYRNTQRIKYEWDILNKLYNFNLGPKPIICGRSYLMVDFIEGKPFSEILSEENFSDYKNKLIHIFRKIYFLYKNEVVIEDLAPDNILFSKNKCYFIDFELHSNSEKRKVITFILSKFMNKVHTLVKDTDREKIRILEKSIMLHFNKKSVCKKQITTPHKMFRKLIGALCVEKVNYVFLRNYEFLVCSEDYSGDLDLLTTSKDVEKITKMLLRLGFKEKERNKVERKYSIFELNGQQVINVHVHINNLYYYELSILDGKGIINHKQKVANFYVPSKEDIIIELVIHGIFRKNFKKKYMNIIEDLLEWPLDFKYIYGKLSEIYSERLANDILSYLLGLDFKRLILLKNKCFLKLLVRNPQKIIPVAINKVRFLYLWATQRLRKPIVLACVGIDGAGKTTLANELVRILENNDQGPRLVYMGKWKNAGTIRTLARKVSNTKKSNSFFHQLLWFLDLCVRYGKEVRFRKEKIIVTDRYPYDLLMLKNPIVNFLLRFYPEPNIAVFLYNDEDILKKRKQINSIGNQKEFFTQINKICRNVVAIKSNNIKKNISDTTKILFEYLI